MRQRRGMLLICVLVCLGIASAITGLTIQSGLRARKQMRRHWQLEQTRSLLDAGVRRAITDYQAGEEAWNKTWDVRNAFDDFAVASVTIESAADGSPNKSDFRVTAELQTNDLSPSVTRRSRVISLTESTKSLPESDTTPEQED